MGKATRLLAVALLAASACGNDTGIVLEISMSSELETALAQQGDDFGKLRVWVGHATEDPSFFRASDDAFFTTPRTRATLATPYRYLLEPTGELADIGPLVFAAAVGDDPADARLPFQIAGFAVNDTPMAFADGQMRVVELKLLPPDGVQSGIDDACIVWGMSTGDPSRISPDDDQDCDGASGTDDCDDLDPSQNNLDRDGDGIASCAGDCLDDPRFDAPWLDPATVHPGAPDPGENDPLVCDHVDEDCDGNCTSAGFDADGSGSTACGEVMADAGGLCHGVPADCDEQLPGNQPLFGAQEACNARDDSCDGFLPPDLPCLIPEGDVCHWGHVRCDEKEGEYEGENDLLHCKPLPDGFTEGNAPPSLCAATVAPQCLEAGDPIGCAFEAIGALRSACHTGASGQCRPDRATLIFPGSAPPDTCQWHIVGGTLQAEWEIGFLDANATADAEVQPTIDVCVPQLAARSRVPNPTQRSVLLLLRSPDSPAFGVRPLVVTIDNEALGDCTGMMTCNFSGG